MTETTGLQPPDDDFVNYLDRQLQERNWSVKELSRRSGLATSVIFRWRKGFRPNIANARLLAQTLDVPIIEVLVEAGQLTLREVNQARTVLAAYADDVVRMASQMQLVSEITQRSQELERRLRTLQNGHY